jgi:hypothetical protein
MILAMSGFITFMVIFGLLVLVLEYSRRRHDLFVPAGSDQAPDRDRQRVLDDLRARRRD